MAAECVDERQVQVTGSVFSILDIAKVLILRAQEVGGAAKRFGHEADDAA